MSIFAGARKCDLKILAEELGETVNDSHKLKDLKKMILASKEYDEESAKEWLNTIVNERKEREGNQRRNEEIQMAERKLKEEQEISERRRQDEIAERKRKHEMEFELQKIRLETEGRSLNSNSVANQNVNITQIKPKLNVKETSWQLRRKPNTTSESTKPQPRYQGPMVATHVRPSDKYRISQLEPRNGRPYATMVLVSQLKAWRSQNEDDDDSSTNSNNEPEMQRSKRTVRKPLRYGDFMPDR
ncbi:hypothetical protein AVEN_132873-1 [Araneus ventricosus]|uniref:Uncharacterized protein n=1 Tax=Araneus ventricosus TaxID=182803 RepID=A0A4Y2VYR0_ARAVE|nr:hypothetical protein AVEN_132873-1 [Araneus ventricosus]